MGVSALRQRKKRAVETSYDGHPRLFKSVLRGRGLLCCACSTYREPRSFLSNRSFPTYLLYYRQTSIEFEALVLLLQVLDDRPTEFTRLSETADGTLSPSVRLFSPVVVCSLDAVVIFIIE